MSGPLLARAGFPDVLVAKAYSHDGKGLDLVLYPGKEAGVFELGFERLTPGGRYRVGGGQLVADELGCGSVGVAIKGRTAVVLSPV